MSKDQEDRILGTLLGLAAGDKIGGPARLAYRVALSLVELREFSPSDILARYVTWWNDGAFDTGPTMAEVMAHMNLGMSNADAVWQVDQIQSGLTAGVNPAHRAVPLSMASFVDDKVLAQWALREAVLTHAHPLAGDVSAAVVLLCRKLIAGKEWRSAVAAIGSGRMNETRLAIEELDREPTDHGGFAPVVLHAALHFVDISRSFSAALDRSIKFSGHANYCPVLVGAFAGARWGASAITHQDLEHCVIEQNIRRVAGLLADGWRH
jgi:ADP-ribosyl-[dinitrogen reductase] hydrolase